MSRETIPPTDRRRIATAALSVTALIAAAVTLLTTAGPATAQPASPADAIATALETDPVYVDPSLDSALPEAGRTKVRDAIERSGLDIFVVVTPVTAGDQWGGSADGMLAAVRERAGRDGAYLALREDASWLTAAEWPDDEPLQAKYAAWAVNSDPKVSDAALATRFLKAIELIEAGDAQDVYERQQDERDAQREEAPAGSAPNGPSEADGDSGGPILLIVAVGVAAALAVGLGVALTRGRRRATEPLALPQQVFATARQASTDELRQQCRDEVARLSELIQEVELVPAGGDGDASTGRAMQRALDAYSCATTVLDGEREYIDLVGVLVLVDIGHDALVAARAEQRGKPVPDPSPLCFFNPLHGSSSGRISWRRLGSRDAIDVAACDQCATAIRRRRQPDALTVETDDGGRIPYFELDPERSVWAVTGFGVLRDDLIERIQRGDFTRMGS